jgi:ankyrin repeat protein
VLTENKMITCLQRADFIREGDFLSRVIQHLSDIKPAVLPCTGFSPLVHAISRGHTHLLPQLLKITDLDKRRAIRVVVEAVQSRKHSALVMLFASNPIKHLMETHDPPILSYANLIGLLSLAIERHCPEMVDTLVLSANATLLDGQGRTPLYVAALSGNSSAIASIVLHLPSTLSFTNPGPEVGVALDLLIHHAGKHPSAPLFFLETFLDLGARIKHTDLGITAFHAAAAVSSIDIMQLLLLSMDQIEVESDRDEEVSAMYGEALEGKTALSTAAGRGNVEMVNMLVDRGADISKKDGHEKRAIILAAEKGHADVMEVLRAAMWKEVLLRTKPASI